MNLYMYLKKKKKKEKGTHYITLMILFIYNSNYHKAILGLNEMLKIK